MVSALKLRYDETLSNFAFDFNSRRYDEEDDTEDLLRAQLMVDPMSLAGGVLRISTVEAMN